MTERVVRTCLQHHVPLIGDTLTCPKGNHPVRKWGTVEKSRFSSAEPRLVGVAVDSNRRDELGLEATDARVKEVKVEEPKAGVIDSARFTDEGGNALNLTLVKVKHKRAGLHPFRLAWRLQAAGEKGSTGGTHATAPTLELGREAFERQKRISLGEGWEEAAGGPRLVLRRSPPPEAEEGSGGSHPGPALGDARAAAPRRWHFQVAG